MKTIVEPLSFEWDHGNINKSLDKHGVTTHLAEEPFTDPHLLTLPDRSHSQNELRFHLLGSTHAGQILFITYCIRQNKIRIISARPADKKERKIYANKKT
ncbi:MAG: BrnT family toxin [bacterium]|nr:BrnT family toxin [Candidatus Microgenomates bacterium CPR3]MCQ3945000.1 BrnT family toxin [bacterium]RIK51350.1 MAG: hypothetical protein DCC61_02800 [Candidatus Microgenomates bacterium]